MTTYYVAGASGPLGTGDGSSEANAAASDNDLTLSDGDTVRFLRGTTVIRASGHGDYEGLDDLTFTDYGDPEDPKPAINCNNLGQAGFAINGDGITFENLRIEGWGSLASGAGGISCSTATNTRVLACDFTTRNSGVGPALGANDGRDPDGLGPELTGNHVSGCYFFTIDGDAFTQQGNTSWHFDACRFEDITGTLSDAIAAHAAPGANFVVENCHFLRCDGKTALDLKDATALIRRNIFIDCESNGIINCQRDYATVAAYNTANDPDLSLPDRMEVSGSLHTIEDNLIIMPSNMDPASGGVVVGDGGNAVIRHNTIINLAGADSSGTRPACISCVDSAVVSRNLLQSTGGGYLTIIGGRVTAAVATFSSDENLFTTDYNPAFAVFTSNDPTPGGTAPFYATGGDLSGYRTLTGNLVDPNSVTSATTFEGGSTFTERDHFKPLTGSGVSNTYGARIRRWIGPLEQRSSARQRNPRNLRK